MIKVKKRNYMMAVSLAAGLALIQLSGCSSSKPEETTAQETTVAQTEAETASIPNPIEDVENEQVFESIGVHMVAPADGENEHFSIISGEVAEITFDENGVSYCYRASNTAEDFAGIFERFTDETLTVNWESGDTAGEAQVKTTQSGGRLASWSWGSTRYTLYTAAAVSDEDCTKIVTSLMELSYHE